MASLAEHTITNKLGDDLHDVLEEKGVSQEVLDGVDHILDYPDIIKEQLELKGSSDGSKTYTGEETTYIKVNVDNTNNTISAILNEDELDKHLVEKLQEDSTSEFGQEINTKIETVVITTVNEVVEPTVEAVVNEKLENLSSEGIDVNELDW
jgi:hypothetical protein